MKKRKIIIIGIITVLCMILCIAIYKVKTAAEAASIGIIGGADGPTAIYLTHGNIMIPLIILAVVVAVIAVSCIAYLLKQKNK